MVPEATVNSFLAGVILWAGIVGTGVTMPVWRWLRWRLRESAGSAFEHKLQDLRIEPFTKAPIGLCERGFFALMVGLEISGAGIAMIGWMTLKMTAGWLLLKNGDNANVIGRITTSVLAANLLSMSFAITGGAIMNGTMPGFAWLLALASSFLRMVGL
jgi:hypothetical protein